MTGDDPSDAFSALGNETRMTVLRALVEDGRPVTRSFSALFEASDEDTSAGFAYHLRQLVGSFVRKRDDDSYELTDAGLRVARSIAAGEYTDSVDRDSVSLPEPCPFCTESALEAHVADNVTTVGCSACERDLLELPFPPAGYANRGGDDLPAAFDRYHRHRIGAFGDGVCPTCGGDVNARIECVAGGPAAADADGHALAASNDTATSNDATHADAEADERAWTPPVVTARFDCGACGDRLRCPVALTVLDHPSIVAFYHEHGETVTDRPVWNVGAEWRETVLSLDPLAVRVTTRLDGDELALYVGRDLTVVETRLMTVEESGPEGVSVDHGEAEATEPESSGTNARRSESSEAESA